MSLTDRAIAERLGWKQFKNIAIGEEQWLLPDGNVYPKFDPPAFSTSIDAVVAEVERRGHDWSLGNFEGHADEFKAAVGEFRVGIKVEHAPTAAMALSMALLAFVDDEGRKS